MPTADLDRTDQKAVAYPGVLAEGILRLREEDLAILLAFAQHDRGFGVDYSFLSPPS